MEFLLAAGCIIALASTGWVVWGVQEISRSRSRDRLQLEHLRQQGAIARQRLELESRQLDDEIYRDFVRHQRPPAPGGPPPP
ncbi:hypothetical protein [Pseudonocardia sp.]|uniref:hypothetical protein n=1 Tax=Pseudonocardia sp. TaxID=60912 RepID=UPI00262A5EC9|nr:hypothetical protein [Pseudonocardia sp.]